MTFGISTAILGCGRLLAGSFLALALLACGQTSEPKEDEKKTEEPPDETPLTLPEPPVDCEWDLSIYGADADNLFEMDHVPVFEMHLPEDKWATLQENATAELWEEAEVCFDGKYIGRTGLRFKGSYGSLYGCFENGVLICDRLSMKLKFDLLNEDLRFFGLKRLNFHSNHHDDSRMKEKLAYDLYRAMDIAAPRASWAVVKVNGQSYGLYGMVEEVDGRFTNNRWPDYPDGNLYKEIWPTDQDAEYILARLHTNEETADISSFLAFGAAINAADSPEAAREVLAEHSDLDHWARYMAVDEAILSYDGVTYFYTDNGVSFHNHNYYLYEDSPGHFAIVPWDVESSFWINPDHAPPHWLEVPEDCTQMYPYWGGFAVAPACDPVLRALATDLDPWREAMQELLDGPFSEEAMTAAIDTHVALIEEEAQKPETPTMYTTFPDAVAYLRSTMPLLRERMELLIAPE